MVMAVGRKSWLVVCVTRGMKVIYTGRLITAQRAQDIGLVDHVLPAQELAKATYDLAREIAENAPLSVSGTKATIARLLSYQTLRPEDEAELGNLQTQAFLSEDLKEGQRAFIEKGEPTFNGR